MNKHIENGVINIKYKVCDIHAHVVPNIDDGAVDLQMSIDILRKAYSQGTKNIVCSSHSWGNLNNYHKNLINLRNHAARENLNISLHSGCEINCSDDRIEDIIFKLNNNIIPTINNTRYVLVEFDPYEDFNVIERCVQKLQESNYISIIAHIERYYEIQNNVKYIENLKELGCLFQINAYSLENATSMKIKNLARELLKQKYVSFIGSDAHRTDHRTYIIEDGIKYIYENCDVEYAKDICYKNAERLLNIN